MTELSPGSLLDLVPLNALSAVQRAELVRTAEVHQLRAGETLDPRRFPAEQSFYVLAGSVEIRTQHAVLSRVTAGTPSAKFGLTQLRAKNALALVVDDAQILRLDLSLISALLLWGQSDATDAPFSAPDEAGDDLAGPTPLAWLSRLLSSELFANIPPANLHRVFDVLEPVTVDAGETIVSQGEPGVFYYVIRSGSFLVSRQAPNPNQDQTTTYRLAELGPGDSFGEEALVSDSVRNATVSSQSPGQLLRLTKEDFVTLIIQPNLRFVDRDTATSLVEAGGYWLDVRLPEEYENDGISGATNIPLHELRERTGELNADARYIVYCNAGRRSAAAGTLLKGWGIETSVLDGGLVSNAPVPLLGEPLPVLERPASAISASPISTSPAGSPLAPASSPSHPAESAQTGALDAEEASSADGAVNPAEEHADEVGATLTSSLAVPATDIPTNQAALADADADVEDALRAKVEATAARRIAANEAERADASPSSQSFAERARLRSRLKRLELESMAAGHALSQAQRRRLELGTALRAEEAQAEKARAKALADCERIRDSAEKKLQLEQDRLTETYAKSEARVAELARLRRDAEVQYERERAALEEALQQQVARFEQEATELRSAMVDAKSDGASRVAEIREEQEHAERTVMAQAEQNLLRERERLEAEFAASVTSVAEAQARIERLKSERLEADASAREFAKRLHAEAERRQLELEEARREKQRELDAEAEEARARIEEARRLKADAEAERQALLEELERLRSGAPAPAVPASEASAVTDDAMGENTLQFNIGKQEERVAEAQGELVAAEQAERAAQSAIESVKELEIEETEAERELRLRLYAEAEEWLTAENENSASTVEETEAHLRSLEELKQRQEQEKATERTRNSHMIWDIEAQLAGNGRPDALAQAMGAQPRPTRRFRHERTPHEEAERDRLKTGEELERARAHINRLKNTDAPT